MAGANTAAPMCARGENAEFKTSCPLCKPQSSSTGTGNWKHGVNNTEMNQPGRVLFAPSPNWYGAHMSCLFSSENVTFVAYCGQRSIVVLAIDSLDSRGRHAFRVHQVLPGYNARTSCVACHVAGDEGELYLVTASQDKCVQTWVLRCPEGDRGEANQTGGESGGGRDAMQEKEGGDAVDGLREETLVVGCGGDEPARQPFFSRHRVMSKRPAEVKAAVSDCSGSVLLGDVKGNVFQWRLGEHGSRIQRVASSIGRGVVTMACLEGVRGIVVVGCADGIVRFVRYAATQDSCDEGLGEVLAEIGSEGATIDGIGIHGLACAKTSGDVHWVASGLSGGRVRVDEVILADGDGGVGGADNGGLTAKVRRRVVELDMLRLATCMNRSGKKSSKEKHGTRFWGSLAWGRVGTRLCLLTEGFGGGMLAWWGLEDIVTEDGLPRHQTLPESHSRAIFRICTGSMDSGALMVTSIGLDRMCSVWRLMPMADVRKELPAKLVSRLVGLGAHPLSLAIHHDMGSGSTDGKVLVACGCGDSTIRLVSCVPGLALDAQDVTTSQIWREIPAPVVALSWGSNQGDAEGQARRSKTPVLAFGCEDGTVGLVDVKQKRIRLGISRHPSPVCLLSWIGDGGSGGNGSNGNQMVQSWCTNGVSMAWPVDLIEEDAAVATGTLTNVNSRDMEPLWTTRITSDESRKITCLAPVASLAAWSEPSQAPAVVVGFSRGALEVHGCCEASTADCVVLARYEMADALSSGAQMVSNTDDGDVVVLTDTGSILVFGVAGGGPRLLCGVADTADAASAIPTCMNAASYMNNGVATLYIAIGFDSGTVRVLVIRDGVIDAKAGGTLEGHAGPVLSMAHRERWLFTSSQDQTVRLWEWTSPSAWSSMAVAGNSESKSMKPNNIISGDSQEGPVSTSASDSKPLGYHNKSSKKDSGAAATLSTLLPGLTMATTNPADPRSEFRNITAFIASTAASIAEKATLQHKKDERQSKALSQRAAALHLWQGNVGKALEVLVENDALTSDFVAFAAGAGRDAWIATSRVYADFLERKGEVHLAALYQLQAGDVVDACLTYERHKMHREAAALAQLWLPPDHPVGVRVVEQLATFLAKGGHESASEVVLSKKKTPTCSNPPPRMWDGTRPHA